MTDTYEYGDASWGDLLTKYNGQPITYDAVGNPETWYDGSTYTWTQGRRLESATVREQGITMFLLDFTYNDQGVRVSKTVNGVEHIYRVNGTQIIQEEWENNLLLYLYDDTGAPVGLRYRNTEYAANQYDTYLFEKNAEGDIIAVYKNNGTKLVSYEYNAWGAIINRQFYGASGEAVEVDQMNPFRYRGYFYDIQSGMYYLNSRYYDPEIGRFINADGYVSTGQGLVGNNMFAYCGNNPVIYKDLSGQFFVPILIVGGLAIGGILLFSGCSAQPTSDVGAAQPYVEMSGSDDPTSPNCYAYAIGSPVNEQPGNISGRIPTKWNDVNDVGKSVEADLEAMGYTVRKISGPNSKVYNNEFKIALRVGTRPCAYNPYTDEWYYDYHFMRQTSTGQWAEKHGYGGDSVLWDFGMTPDTIPWTLGGMPYYDSKIIYYAIGK